MKHLQDHKYSCMLIPGRRGAYATARLSLSRLQLFKLAGETVKIHSPESHSDALRFLDWVSNKQDLGLDTETTGKTVWAPDHRVRLVQFGTRDESWCLPVGEGFDWAIRRTLEDPRRSYVLHNAPFDVAALHREKLIDGHEFINRCRDSYIPAHLADPRDVQSGGVGHALKPQVAAYIDAAAADAQEELHRVFKQDLGCKRQADGWRIVPTSHPTYTLYAGLDPMFAVRLEEFHKPTVQSSKQAHLLEFEHRLQQITTRMMLRGLKLDTEYTQRLSLDLVAEQQHWDNIALEEYGVENANSNDQVAEALIADGWKPDAFTDTGKPKLTDKVLEDLYNKGYGLAKAVVQSKRCGKFNASYADAMLRLRDSDDRIHPMIAALRARTARMSISDPAFQQLPSGDATIRHCLVADPGNSIVSVDYSQVEMRILAALAHEPRMLEQIRSGRKIHEVVCEMMYGPGSHNDPKLYKLAKNTGFGEVFGGGAKTLAAQAGVDIEVAREAKKMFADGFPGIKQYGKYLMELASGSGYTVTNPYGRVLPVDKDRLYSVTNYMIQSTARDLFGHDLLLMADLGLEDYLMLPVHDEVLAQAPKEDADDLAHEIEQIMSTADWKGVPIVAEAEIYGDSWGSGYE